VSERKHYLFVCVNKRPDGVPKGSCAARGAVEIHAALKASLQERGLAKVEARACTASCLDTCWAGPVIAVEPDGFFYGRVTMADVPEIVDALAKGGRVERLVLPPADYDEATALPALPLPAPAAKA
jgi:(2Fe-2S) ferredoxin